MLCKQNILVIQFTELGEKKKSPCANQVVLEKVCNSTNLRTDPVCIVADTCGRTQRILFYKEDNRREKMMGENDNKLRH